MKKTLVALALLFGAAGLATAAPQPTAAMVPVAKHHHVQHHHKHHTHHAKKHHARHVA